MIYPALFGYYMLHLLDLHVWYISNMIKTTSPEEFTRKANINSECHPREAIRDVVSVPHVEGRFANL